MQRGKLIVFEAIDSAGKDTQINLLKSYFSEKNMDSIFVRFPKHDEAYGKCVDMYLRGEFGQKEDLAPEFIAGLYVTDFYHSKVDFEKRLSEGKNIVLSRFFYSTMAYQCALIDDEAEKQKFRQWLLSATSRLHKPDLIMFLDVNTDITKKFLENSSNAESYKQGNVKDIHEHDLSYQDKVYNEYKKNIKQFDMKTIDCVQNGEMMSIQDIQTKIRKTLDKFLMI